MFMGTEILRFYDEKIKKRWKLAFISAFVIGLLVHIYKFTNMLPNADAMYNFYNSQNMVATGRWFLTVACGFGSWFDLPWVNGILSLVFIGVAAAAVSEVFDMDNPCLIVLSSALLVTYPAITATLTFEYTADGYMMAMALAAVSTVLSRMEYIGYQHWKKLTLSSVCICLACGIYQAYLSFAFVLAVCYFMTELLENKRESRMYWKWIGVQVLIYGGALAGYYLLWKLCLNVQGYEASGYQGMNQIGVMGGVDLLGTVVRIAKDFALFLLEWNILEHGVTLYSALNILFIIVFAVGIVTAVLKSGCVKRRLHLLLFLLCLAALPVGCYICYLTSPSVFYHALMLQAVSLLYIMTAVLADRWRVSLRRGHFANIVLAVLVAISLNNAVSANIYYNWMHQGFISTQAAAAELSTRVHMLDDGSIRYVIIHGNLKEWNQESRFTGSELRHLGPYKTISRTLMSPMYMMLYADFDLSYYRSQNLEYPVMEFDAEIPAPGDWEFRFPTPGIEEREALVQSPEVQAMPIWPARDSVQVIGDTIVVKLSEN